MKRRLLYITIVVAMAIYLSPILWLYAAAFKTRSEIFSLPPTMLFSPTLNNFRESFIQRGFITPLWNSIVASVISTLISTVVSVTAAYALSRVRTKLMSNVYFFIFTLLILPPIVTVLPVYLLFTKLFLTGTIGGLIILYVALLSPFGSILLKSFFDKISLRYEEVALIERVPFGFFFRRVFIREARMPILIAALFMFLLAWNEFLYSMIITSASSNTLPVSTLGLITPVGTFWGQIAAIGLVCTLPVLILVFVLRKHLVSGFTYGIVVSE